MRPKSPSFFTLLQTEYKNISVFYVVVFIAGILCWLDGLSPAPLYLGIASATALLSLFLNKRRSRLVHTLAFMTLFFCAGCLAAGFRAYAVRAPVIRTPLYRLDIQGTISEAALLMDTQTIVLSDIRFLNEPTVMPPLKIKLKYNQTMPRLTVGQTLQARVSLRPPGRPVAPGAYNEARALWFQQIGAVGTIDTITALSPVPDFSPLKTKIEHIRTVIGDRIKNTIPDETARIAIPLVIGEQGVVSQHLYDIFRSAGITHVLSVSGFHLSLLAALIFFLIRGGLSFFPTLIEHVPAKKIAALTALIFSAAYISISGLQIPAIRSLIMIAVVLIATLFDRNAFSVRSLTIAAFLILAVRPEMVLNIGFQLSFMAVLILVTLYDPLSHLIFPNRPVHLLLRFAALVAGFMIVDILTALATTPFIIYHFNQYALYSGVGNLLTGTLLSFWVMPMLLFATLLMPLGGDILFLKAAALGLEYVIIVCESIQDWPHALTTFPAYGVSALLIMTLGVICLCLMKTRLRFIGFPLMAAGILCAALSPRPDLLIGDQGRSVAERTEDGSLRFLTAGPSDYIRNAWLLRNGETPEPLARAPDNKLPASLWIKQKRIAFSFRDCPGAALCFLPDRDPHLPNALPLYEFNTRAVYVTPAGVFVRDAARNDTGKPWH